jgi:hypothetical protein
MEQFRRVLERFMPQDTGSEEGDGEGGDGGDGAAAGGDGEGAGAAAGGSDADSDEEGEVLRLCRAEVLWACFAEVPTRACAPACQFA